MPRRAYDTEEITGEKFDRNIYLITIDYITVWTRPEINNVIGQDSMVMGPKQKHTPDHMGISAYCLFDTSGPAAMLKLLAVSAQGFSRTATAHTHGWLQ